MEEVAAEEVVEGAEDTSQFVVFFFAHPQAEEAKVAAATRHVEERGTEVGVVFGAVGVALSATNPGIAMCHLYNLH